MIKIDRALIEKYNTQGPRYTSYPTVPYWMDSPTEAQWIESLNQAFQSAQDEKTGAALYIHIPFCMSLCTYCGCNTRITRKKEVGRPYVQSVIKEWELYRKRLSQASYLPIADLHLGGGTPTFLSPEELKELVEGVLGPSNCLSGGEYSIEVDPRTTTLDHLKVLRSLGFSRISLGVQDFDRKVQDSVNRVNSVEMVQSLTEAARTEGFKSVNFDLIYGLPFQTRDSIRQTIESVARIRPDRIAFYAYAHVPWIKPSQRRFTEDDLPKGEEKRDLYEIGREIFEENGYREIGLDHFALESDSLWIAAQKKNLHRNFMGYISERVFPLVGLGVSAIGDSWKIFSQNEKHLEKYEGRIAADEIPIHRGHILTDEDQIIRKHILNLMTRLETKWDLPSLKTPFLDNVASRLAEPIQDGLVQIDGSSCVVTEKGRPFLRNICMAFDARLAEKSPETQVFSKTV